MNKNKINNWKERLEQKKLREEIMAIEDDEIRLMAIQDNLELFEDDTPNEFNPEAPIYLGKLNEAYGADESENKGGTGGYEVQPLKLHHGSTERPTREQIMAIPDPEKRQLAIQDNMDLFE
ncbi:hypothetical protein [Facklamia hominis]|uniref:Uncharacterized protein n=1 Tax=Facklamia hominis TaxID=178214 RepID=A0AAJ1V2V8_9LACT|nr:hypothetical protein [Facklamia hominis]MDK7187503.1 hypothetical protein [Facklamia hominis]